MKVGYELAMADALANRCSSSPRGGIPADLPIDAGSVHMLGLAEDCSLRLRPPAA